MNPNAVSLKPVSRGNYSIGQSRASNASHPKNRNATQTIVAAGGQRSVMSSDPISGVTSVMSAGSGLPNVREPNHLRTMDAANPPPLRKASPEAIALMMANKKKNDEAKKTGSSWVPGGSGMGLKKNESRQRNLFY